MKRSKHSLSHYKLVTADMGKLIPVATVEALPGDTFQHSTSMLLRLSPLLAPVMHPVSVRIHHWFVPNRLLWSDWEKFITGGPDGLGAPTPYPANTGALTVAAGEVLDYMGVPTTVAFPAGQVGLLPLYAYNKIFNDWYRDEDLVTERALTDNTLAKCAWEKDYFTTARPWSQKGPAVTIPLGASAPVKTSASQVISGAQEALTWRRISDGGVGGSDVLMGREATTGRAFDTSGLGGVTKNLAQYPSNLYADLATASSPDIIDFRRAFALQRYQEARAQYGSRYTEYLRYLGIRSSDARLQRPEYLGGGKQTIAFSEVLRTGDSSGTNPVGEMKGHGIAAMRSNRYRFFCEEHGWIISLLSVRPRSMYNNGLHRSFSRRSKEDYFQKELELIGQQEVTKGEVYAAASATNLETWGYQDRYADYRHQPSHVSGLFRSTLDFWHMGRKFASLPALNAAFVECDPAKRIFADTGGNNHCWMMVSNSIQVRRLVGKKTIGRII